MARNKITLPESFSFQTSIPIRITDVNYGNHVGNDAVLSILHEARIQFLLHYGYSEMNMAGVGLIMANVSIEFKKEMFYGDIIKASVTAGNFTSIGFNLFYKLEKEENSNLLVVAESGMVCYDYQKKKVAALPDEAKEKLDAK